MQCLIKGDTKNNKRSKGGCLWNAFGSDKETDSNKKWQMFVVQMIDTPMSHIVLGEKV